MVDFISSRILSIYFEVLSEQRAKRLAIQGGVTVIGPPHPLVEVLLIPSIVCLAVLDLVLTPVELGDLRGRARSLLSLLVNHLHHCHQHHCHTLSTTVANTTTIPFPHVPTSITVANTTTIPSRPLPTFVTVANTPAPCQPTCEAEVAFSGVLSSLIRKNLGNLREMPFSGSTCEMMNELDVSNGWTRRRRWWNDIVCFIRILQVVTFPHALNVVWPSGSQALCGSCKKHKVIIQNKVTSG